MRFIFFLLIMFFIGAELTLFGSFVMSGDAASGWDEPSSVCPDTFINQGGSVVYEASDYKAKRWAVYFFCLTLLLVVAAVIFMKD